MKPNTSIKSPNEDKVRDDRLIFIGAFILLAALIIPILAFPEQSQKIMTAIQQASLNGFGWGFLLFSFGALILCIAIAVSKLGKTKMGSPSEKPDYSTFSWIAMLFCAGQGSSIIYWGCIEWAHYYTSPPPGYASLSVEAANISTALSFLHWGPTAWALYCLPAIPMTYLYWRRRDPILRLSQTCSKVLPVKLTRGRTGSVIDLVVLIVILISYVATLGLGTPMIATGLEYFFNIPPTMWTKLAIILAWSAVFCTSVWKGLDSGIQNLSRINVWVAFVMLGMVLIFGPTAFIFNKACDSIGLLLQNYMQWSLFTDAIGQNSFAQGWTIFYFAWCITVAPFMGLWVARISKGRSLREIIIAELVVSAGSALMVFAILGGYGVHAQTIQGIDIVGVLEAKGDTWAIVTILTSLPLGKIILALMLITMFINLATSLDSTAFVLSQLSCKNLKLGQEPPRWYRMFWAVALVVVPVALTISGADGSLQTLQTFIIAPSIPTLIFICIMMVSFFLMVKEDKGLPYAEIIRNHYKRNKPEIEPEAVDELVAPFEGDDSQESSEDKHLTEPVDIQPAEA